MLFKSFHFTVVGIYQASQSGFSKTLSFESFFNTKRIEKLKKESCACLKRCTVYKEVITFDPSAYSRRVIEKTR